MKRDCDDDSDMWIKENIETVSAYVSPSIDRDSFSLCVSIYR